MFNGSLLPDANTIASDGVHFKTTHPHHVTKLAPLCFAFFTRKEKKIFNFF